LSALFIFVLVGLLVFSTSCQFLEFWFQGTDSESNPVVRVFIYLTDEQLVLQEVHI